MNPSNQNDISHLSADILEMLEAAEALKNEQEFEEAIKILQAIVIEYPDCVEAYEEIGDNYMSLREIEKAEKALRHALKLNAHSANSHYLLGFLFSLQHKWSHSVEELQKADHLFPNHPEILRCLGWAIYNCNRQSQGIAVLERSQNLSPNDINIMCDLGVCYMTSSKVDLAKNIFEKVVKAAPNSEQAKECKMFIELLKKQSTQSE